MTLLENAPAKINLGLKVLGKRKDGFHDILSIFQTVNLYDELTITSSGKPGLVCSHSEVPLDSQNLVLKAEKLFRKLPGDFPRAHYTLKKRIPVGAGLAGGSSDAAAALRGLMDFHKKDVDDTVLYNLAGKLGSDVPFLMKGGTSVVSGRGEIIENIAWPFDFFYVIVYPNFSVSTSWAYGNLKEREDTSDSFKKMIDKLKISSIHSDEIFSVLHNDFEETVFEKYPVLGKIKTRIMHKGAHKALLTGSGSSVLGIFDERERAVCCAHSLKSSKFEIFIVKKC